MHQLELFPYMTDPWHEFFMQVEQQPHYRAFLELFHGEPAAWSKSLVRLWHRLTRHH